MKKIFYIFKVSILGTFCLILINSNAFCRIIPPEGWQEVNAFVETTPKPVPSKKDIDSGFIPFTRNYMEPLYSNSRPKKREITDSFNVTLARGEYEPLVVGLYGLKNQSDIHIEIDGAVSDFGLFEKDQIEIRRIRDRAVRAKDYPKKGIIHKFLSSLRKNNTTERKKFYKIIPSILEINSSVDLKKDNTAGFWITFHAFENTPTGIYQGFINVTKGSTLLRTLRFTITVLPFILEEIPDKVFSMLYIPVNQYFSERNARMLLQDMRNHGMTSYSPEVVAWGDPLGFNASGEPQVDSLLDHLQWATDAGFRGPTLLYFGKLIRATRPDLKANYTKYSEQTDLPNLQKFVRFLESKRKQSNWPEIIYIPIDEPGSFTDQTGTKREEMAHLFLKELQALNVRGCTTIADLVDNKHRKLPRWKNVVGWWDKIKPFCSVRIYLNGFPEGETCLANEIKDADSRGHEVMLYENSSTMGSNPCVSRMYFGYYGWSTGVKGLTSWTHPTLGNATISHIWNLKKEKIEEMEAYFRNELWKPPPSTICWEMIREGIDDAKYLYAFKRALKKNALLSGNYTNFLKNLKNAVASTDMAEKHARCEWSGTQFSDIRKHLTEGILELSQPKNQRKQTPRNRCN